MSPRRGLPGKGGTVTSALAAQIFKQPSSGSSVPLAAGELERSSVGTAPTSGSERCRQSTSQRSAPRAPDPGHADTSRASGSACSTAASDDAPPRHAQNSADFWRAQIEAIYRRRNPAKFREVPALLRRYSGREVQLYRKVCRMYDLEPLKLYADPKAWEGEDKDLKDDPDDGNDAGIWSVASRTAHALGLARRTDDESRTQRDGKSTSDSQPSERCRAQRPKTVGSPLAASLPPFGVSDPSGGGTVKDIVNDSREDTGMWAVASRTARVLGFSRGSGGEPSGQLVESSQICPVQPSHMFSSPPPSSLPPFGVADPWSSGVGREVRPPTGQRGCSGLFGESPQCFRDMAGTLLCGRRSDCPNIFPGEAITCHSGAVPRALQDNQPTQNSSRIGGAGVGSAQNRAGRIDVRPKGVGPFAFSYHRGSTVFGPMGSRPQVPCLSAPYGPPVPRRECAESPQVFHDCD